VADPEKDTLQAGTRLGQYEVARLIGAGGMGSIYEGHHVALKKRVAIKVLSGDFTGHAEARARFVREGEAAARIQHPNVVEVFDVGINEQDRPYLVMEFLRGEDAAALIAREGALPVEDAVDLLCPVISAVAAAHALGVLHRDLKPDNVFLSVSHDGGLRPKLLDFGISKLEGGPANHALTRADAFLGTPFYVAPEQAQGGANATAASDQYSLGVIAYELLTGKRPFGGDSLYEVLHSIVQGRFQSPAAHRPDLPPGLTDVVLRAMATNPADRFESVRALGRALLPFASEGSRAAWMPAFDDAAASSKREGTGRFSIATGASVLTQSQGRTTTGDVPAVREVERVHTTLSNAAGEIGDDVRLPSSSPLPWLAAAAALVLVGGGALAYFALRSGEPSGPPQASRPTEQVAPTLAVAISADPPNATFLLDGRPAGTRQLNATVPRDGRAHEVLVAAAGYETARIAFTDSPPPSTIRLVPLSALPVGVAPPPVEALAGPVGPVPQTPEPQGTADVRRDSSRRGPRGSDTTVLVLSPPPVAVVAPVAPPPPVDVEPPSPPRHPEPVRPVTDVGANNAAIVD
jgi:serine/threonine-protein kinase